LLGVSQPASSRYDTIVKAAGASDRTVDRPVTGRTSRATTEMAA